MRPLPLIAALAASVSWVGAPPSARADQLQCNSARDAERARNKVQAGAIAIAYCSLCDDRVEVIRVVRSEVVQDCGSELEVTGELLLRSERLPEGTFSKRTRFAAAQGSFEQRVDLAYFYVEVSTNKFKWLGGVIGLRATVHTKTIRLPASLYERLGAGSLVAEEPPPPPRTKMSQLGFSLFKRGPLAKAVLAFDRGKLDDAQRAADDALSRLVAKSIARAGIQDLPGSDRFQALVEEGLRDRLRHSSRPLASLYTAAELKHLEKLPPRALEQAIVVLAVWAAISASREDALADLDQAAVSLVTNPRTVHALNRRAPLAAQLARFYGALFHLALGTEGQQTADVKLMARRVAQYFSERHGLSGNYDQVLTRLAR